MLWYESCTQVPRNGLSRNGTTDGRDGAKAPVTCIFRAIIFGISLHNSFKQDVGLHFQYEPWCLYGLWQSLQYHNHNHRQRCYRITYEAANPYPLHIAANPYPTAYSCKSLSCCMHIQGESRMVIIVNTHFSLDQFDRSGLYFRGSKQEVLGFVWCIKLQGTCSIVLEKVGLV